MGKAIIVLPPPGSGAHGGEKECTTCHRLKGANLFKDSNVCTGCTLMGSRAQSRNNGSSEIHGKSSYSKIGKHQENFSATKYIKP
mmetsp:Transcript_30871/g.51005  ORF Transcript_30871/g.51005 Transcript_30871/m.51005 type:complete len:85 (-) Transcript_30871:275-529(-)